MESTPKCPVCKCNKLFWQNGYVTYFICSECGVMFKAPYQLQEVFERLDKLKEKPKHGLWAAYNRWFK